MASTPLQLNSLTAQIIDRSGLTALRAPSPVPFDESGGTASQGISAKRLTWPALDCGTAFLLVVNTEGGEAFDKWLPLTPPSRQSKNRQSASP